MGVVIDAEDGVEVRPSAHGESLGFLHVLIQSGTGGLFLLVYCVFYNGNVSN